MNRMNEQELSNLQGVRDCLIVDEALHVADTTFCLVVPTTGANCGLSDSQSLQIIGALTWQKEPTKQTRHRWWWADRLSDA